MLEIVLIVIAGILATAAMTLTMYLIHSFGLANGDMLRAIGSYVTKRYNKSLGMGLGMHLVAGVVFAVMYFTIWKTFEIYSPRVILLSGSVMGLIHGFIVSFFLVIIVAEHHPLERFRQVGFGVALTHVIGHVVYGLVLGALVGYLSGAYQTGLY